VGAYAFIMITVPGDFDWNLDIDGRDLPDFGNSYGLLMSSSAYCLDHFSW
jgi:hypothetical protein